MTNASARRLDDLLFIRNCVRRAWTRSEHRSATKLGNMRCIEIMAMGTPSGDELAELDSLISIFA